ncbi:hypothetical protein [Aquimarina sp. RZ0]|uniref:hypothetical protein n=1 Tax=Aquimarina sp. RZ0 TaxID=2607730 RepID=UPI0011F3F775|nr:hypothetical protein [Aquimarina sp. RZ0]KAA1241017.1 hypothetical protein F0000_26760 [Aquimarina sp. RZ0]
MGILLYSTFFENSDFYNILGSLCKIRLGYKGSSYLYYKTKKLDRLLGTGEKIDQISELLEDCNKEHIISFFKENHFKEIRNTFFHSAYSLTDEEYFLHDSEPIIINNWVQNSLNFETFITPKIEKIIAFFDFFKNLFLDSFNSYQNDKIVNGLFPNPVEVTIKGSERGLKGFIIKNSVQFYGKWHDSGIFYDEQYDMWTGKNITMYFPNLETIEIGELLRRYEDKDDIRKNNSEFFNLIDKIAERNNPNEKLRGTMLLVKFGNVRYEKMEAQQNEHKKNSFPKIILPYYKQAIELGGNIIDPAPIKKLIKELETEQM